LTVASLDFGNFDTSLALKHPDAPPDASGCKNYSPFAELQCIHDKLNQAKALVNAMQEAIIAAMTADEISETDYNSLISTLSASSHTAALQAWLKSMDGQIDQHFDEIKLIEARKQRETDIQGVLGELKLTLVSVDKTLVLSGTAYAEKKAAEKTRKELETKMLHDAMDFLANEVVDDMRKSTVLASDADTEIVIDTFADAGTVFVPRIDSTNGFVSS
jgi:hypothetical protein